MISNKLLWTGLTVMLAGQYLNFDPILPKVGAVIMVIGAILLWLDK